MLANLKHEMFCTEWVRDRDTGRAYRVAYPDCGVASAGSCGRRLLQVAAVRDRVDELLSEQRAALQVEAMDVLKLLWETATADASELMRVRVDCCRHCYGLGGRYQYTQAEWEGALAEYGRRVQNAHRSGAAPPEPPDPLGGVGFYPKLPPAPACPECFGDGVQTVQLTDSAGWSEGARRLYAGAKVTKNGIEILTHSRDKNIELVGKHLAMFTDKVDHSNKGGAFEPMSIADFYNTAPPPSDDGDA